MSKINLEWFLGKGYKLSVGDIVAHLDHDYDMVKTGVESWNGAGSDDDERLINSFAWRKNEGVKPDFLPADTVIDVKGNNGVEFTVKAFNCKQWRHTEDKSSNGAYYAMLKWRYNYEALLKQQEVDTLEAVNNPDIAAEDGGKLPEGVSRDEFDKGMRESMKRIAKAVGKTFGSDIGYENLPDLVESCLTQFVISDQNGDTIDYEIVDGVIEIDTRTDEEKLIDDIAIMLGSRNSEIAREFAARMLDKFNITRKDK